MRKIWRLRYVTFASLLALAAVLLLLGRGGDSASATPFAPFSAALVGGSTSSPVSDPSPVSAAVTQGPFGVLTEIPDFGIIFTPGDWGVASGVTGNATTLSAAVLAGDSEIPVVSVASLPTSSTTVQVDSEQMTYTTTDTTAGGCTPVSPPCLTGVSRGDSGTADVGHASGAIVFTSPGIAIGDHVGTASVITFIGTANSACATFFPLFGLILINASVDRSALITTASNFTNLIADSDANGIPDGAQGFPDILDSFLTSHGITATPVQRSWTQIPDFTPGTNVVADVVTFAPGDAADSSFGYATVIVIENFSPSLPPTPFSGLTDSCSFFAFLTTSTVSLPGPGPLIKACAPKFPVCSVLADVPEAAGGTTLRTNPSTAGTKLFITTVDSNRDADADGFDNGDDTCIFIPNLGSPFVTGPGDGDTEFGEVPGDGIDEACDLTPGTPCSAIFLVLIACDGDTTLNRNDDCPQTFDFFQLDVLELAAPPIDGGPTFDMSGDACDVNPTVNDGHFHSSKLVSAICITSGSVADADGDGWCDGKETSLGSDKDVATSTPEDLSILSSCSDGIDNDKDGGDGGGPLSTDLGISPPAPAGATADSGCLETEHDLEATIDDAATVIFDPENSCMSTNETNARGNALYKIKIEEEIPDGSEAKPLLIGFLINPLGASGPTVKSTNFVAITSATGGLAALGPGSQVIDVQGATVVADGPMNIDGDVDVERLTLMERTGEKTVELIVNFEDFNTCVDEVAGVDTVVDDYELTVDVCLEGDPAPLGLIMLPTFGPGLPGDCGTASADGDQDADPANDTPGTIKVNSLTD